MKVSVQCWTTARARSTRKVFRNALHTRAVASDAESVATCRQSSAVNERLMNVEHLITQLMTALVMVNGTAPDSTASCSP